MKIERLDASTVAISHIEALCLRMLEQIVPSADPGDDKQARGRLFPSPSGAREPEFDHDWHDYVEPDLRRLFQGALDVVREDLARLPSATRRKEPALPIPVKNLEAWIHALNQARLALAARYGFTERDMSARAPVEGDERALALFQVHFYGFLQECFLRELA